MTRAKAEFVQPCLYPATPTPEPEGGTTLVFRDIPEAITYGASDAEARAMAAEVLELAVAERMERGEEVPVCSAAKPGGIVVPLRPSLCGPGIGPKWQPMKLTNLTIRNFRCIRDLSLDLDQTTVLIGENNTGKMAVLEAVRVCLERLRGRGRRLFDDYDYHLANAEASPMHAEPIEICLSFVESEAEPWAEEVGQALADVASFGLDDRRRVTLRVSSQFDNGANDFMTDWSFLDANGEALAGTARSARLLNTLQGLVPVFYLSALRDASRHFVPSGRFWRSFLGELGVPEGQRQDVLTELNQLNRRLIEAHGPLAEVRGELEKAKNVVDFGAADAVTVDALPTKLLSLLSRAQVQLASRSGAHIPVAEQGEGTQSLAVLLLFGAFLRSRFSGLDPEASAITALEEPEAHLHPSATRTLMQLVDELPGQQLISTHSGHMLASVPATAIQRLAYEGGDIKAYRIDANSLTDGEKRKFDFHVRRSRGELLFARCWLLVEGESEVVLLTGAAEALDLNLERKGVCCVEYSQSDVGMLAKIANQLGITEELGDALWYLLRIVDTFDCDMVTLDHLLGPVLHETRDDLDDAIELGAAAGNLLHVTREPDSAGAIRSAIDRVASALFDVGASAKLSWREVATFNRKKILSRWPRARDDTRVPECTNLEEEQFPHRLCVEFREVARGEHKAVVLRCRGLNLGDRLTDNIKEQDYYRFHDVFHFAYAVCLGWSPVLRSLLKCKRKSRPDVDENQDGARVVVVEEAVSAYVFSHAKAMAYFDHVESLDYELLKTVGELVKGYEVEGVSLSRWERAILAGYRIFRDLRRHNGGNVILDFESQTLSYFHTKVE